MIVMISVYGVKIVLIHLRSMTMVFIGGYHDFVIWKMIPLISMLIWTLNVSKF